MTASWTSMWRAKTTSGSPEARKSWIQASAAWSLPRAARRCSVPELRQALGAQRRGDAGVELAQVQRLLAQPGDDVVLGQPVLALVVERDGHDDLALGRAAGAATSDFSRRTKQRRRRCQCRRSSESWPRNWRAKRAPEPKSSRRPMTRSWLMSSSAWLSTGVPVRARRRPSGTTVSASRRTAWVRLACGFLHRCDSSTMSARGRMRPSASRWAATTS